MTPDEVIKADAALHRLLKAVKAKASLEAETDLYMLASDFRMEKSEHDAALVAVKQVVGECIAVQISTLTQEAIAAGVEIKEDYLADVAAEHRGAVEDTRTRRAAWAQGQIAGLAAPSTQQ